MADRWAPTVHRQGALLVLLLLGCLTLQYCPGTSAERGEPKEHPKYGGTYTRRDLTQDTKPVTKYSPQPSKGHSHHLATKLRRQIEQGVGDDDKTSKQEQRRHLLRQRYLRFRRRKLQFEQRDATRPDKSTRSDPGRYNSIPRNTQHENLLANGQMSNPNPKQQPRHENKESRNKATRLEVLGREELNNKSPSDPETEEKERKSNSIKRGKHSKINLDMKGLLKTRNQDKSRKGNKKKANTMVKQSSNDRTNKPRKQDALKRLAALRKFRRGKKKNKERKNKKRLSKKKKKHSVSALPDTTTVLSLIKHVAYGPNFTDSQVLIRPSNSLRHHTTATPPTTKLTGHFRKSSHQSVITPTTPTNPFISSTRALDYLSKYDYRPKPKRWPIRLVLPESQDADMSAVLNFSSSTTPSLTKTNSSKKEDNKSMQGVKKSSRKTRVRAKEASGKSKTKFRPHKKSKKWKKKRNKTKTWKRFKTRKHRKNQRKQHKENNVKRRNTSKKFQSVTVTRSNMPGKVILVGIPGLWHITTPATAGSLSTSEVNTVASDTTTPSPTTMEVTETSTANPAPTSSHHLNKTGENMTGNQSQHALPSQTPPTLLMNSNVTVEFFYGNETASSPPELEVEVFTNGDINNSTSSSISTGNDTKRTNILSSTSSFPAGPPGKENKFTTEYENTPCYNLSSNDSNNKATRNMSSTSRNRNCVPEYTNDSLSVTMNLSNLSDNLTSISNTSSNFSSDDNSTANANDTVISTSEISMTTVTAVLPLSNTNLSPNSSSVIQNSSTNSEYSTVTTSQVMRDTSSLQSVFSSIAPTPSPPPDNPSTNAYHYESESSTFATLSSSSLSTFDSTGSKAYSTVPSILSSTTQKSAISKWRKWARRRRKNSGKKKKKMKKSRKYKFETDNNRGSVAGSLAKARDRQTPAPSTKSPFVTYKSAYDFLSKQRPLHGIHGNEDRRESYELNRVMASKMCKIFNMRFVPTNIGGKCV